MNPKPKILFVDDEESILKGLRRVLNPKRKEWEMTFALGGEHALKLLEETPQDLVVSDLLMPGMSGMQLLTKIKEKYPDVRRIILTGQPSRKFTPGKSFTADEVFPVHRYAMKPCDFDSLVKMIEEVLSLDEIELDAATRQLLNSIESLPVLPGVYSSIIDELNRNEPNMEQLALLVSQDIGLCSKLISLVNSPYYGLPKINEPKEAVMLLGFDIIYALVMTIHAFTEFDTVGFPEFSISDLWDHSRRTACLSKVIAENLGKSTSEANDIYLSGLLHDIGKLVFAHYFSEKYHLVLSHVKQRGCFLYEAEEDIFGTNHSKIGAHLMGLWGISPPAIRGILNHHEVVPSGEKKDLEYCVSVANLVDHVHENSGVEKTKRERYEDKLHLLASADQVTNWLELAKM